MAELEYKKLHALDLIYFVFLIPSNIEEIFLDKMVVKTESRIMHLARNLMLLL